MQDETKKNLKKNINLTSSVNSLIRGHCTVWQLERGEKAKINGSETMDCKPSLLQSDATCMTMPFPPADSLLFFFLTTHKCSNNNNSRHKKINSGSNNVESNIFSANIFSALNGGHISPMGSILLLLLIHISSLMVEVDSCTSPSSDPTSNHKRCQHDLCHLYTGLIAHHGELGVEGVSP